MVSHVLALSHLACAVEPLEQVNDFRQRVDTEREATRTFCQPLSSYLEGQISVYYHSTLLLDV